MDKEFEAEMLRVIDDFLSSDGQVEQFRRLQKTLGPYYFKKSQSATAAIEKLYPKPIYRPDQSELQEYSKWNGYAESRRVHQAQMPQERRLFFQEVLEQATFTTPEGWRPEERRALGFLQLSEYVDFVRKEREEYRQKFGV